MFSDLKICIVNNKDNTETVNKSNEIVDLLNIEFRKPKVIRFNDINKNISVISRTKPNIYLFFTDNLHEYESFYEKLKRPSCSILITNNLNFSFIEKSINLSNDIIYAKNDTDNIVNEIKNYIKEWR